MTLPSLLLSLVLPVAQASWGDTGMSGMDTGGTWMDDSAGDPGETWTGTCGDASCDADEDPWACPEDCGTPTWCGDAICDADEDPWACAEDCGAPLVCGDATCDEDEDATTCPEDCGTCGNGRCEALEETPASCPEDCTAVCGDGDCELFQESHTTCPEDCDPPQPMDFRIRTPSGITGARG